MLWSQNVSFPKQQMHELDTLWTLWRGVTKDKEDPGIYDQLVSRPKDLF